jgi:hypothetical protein
MTRFCMDCKKLLGEKCPHCGSLDIASDNPEQTCFHCRHCGQSFTEGQGGSTDGCCSTCIDKRNCEITARRKAAP